jgi:Raf kinase inhibitor-like YbhB/YbcL family protein
VTGIRVRSEAFHDNDPIPHRYGRDGENISPGLQWSGIPDGTVELLLLCEDPDAPHGPFLHWLVTGIDPACTAVEPGNIPAGGRVWLNDFAELGYGGPQPPVGDKPHRYFFRLFALTGPVRLPRHPTVADVHHAIRHIAHTSGTLVGRSQR